MKRYILLLICVFTASVHATTDIVYKCKNDKGKSVFQQVACDESQVTGDSTAHQLWRKMRALSSEGKNILAVLGGDVNSIKQCNRDIVVFRAKVEELNASVAQVSREHKALAKAHTYLKDCAVCKTSAEANCRTADKYLEEAVAKLTEY